MNSADKSYPTESSSVEFEAPSIEMLGAQLPQYEIRRLVAKGGMGAVYEGYQSQLDRKVAIKVLRPDDSLGPEYEGHFRSEARAMARLQHSNIVTVYDFGETASGLHYIAMEYVEGSTLFDLIHDGALDQARVLDIMVQVCAALQYAHERGVIHRDVKPANILVSPDGCVKMADFGLAKLRGTAGGLGDAMIGTPEYAAPEVRDPKVQVDHRADIYSAGILIFEMLVGRAPVVGSNDVPSCHVDSDPRFDRIVAMAANALPSGRYQKASELAAEIEKIRANPAGRQLRVGAAAAEAQKGRAGKIAPRPAAAAPTAPVNRISRKVAAPVVTPVMATRSAPVQGGVKTLPRKAVPRSRPKLRALPGGEGGAGNWLIGLLFIAVVGLVIWIVSALNSKEAQPKSGGVPEKNPPKEAVDPIKEAEKSLR
jgi:serine/threonine protein kinase